MQMKRTNTVVQLTNKQSVADIETNKSALEHLFNEGLPQGDFSGGRINLFEAIKETIKQDHQLAIDLLAEMAVTQHTNAKKHKALKAFFIKRVSIVALEMNSKMAKRH